MDVCIRRERINIDRSVDRLKRIVQSGGVFGGDKKPSSEFEVRNSNADGESDYRNYLLCLRYALADVEGCLERIKSGRLSEVSRDSSIGSNQIHQIREVVFGDSSRVSSIYVDNYIALSVDYLKHLVQIYQYVLNKPGGVVVDQSLISYRLDSAAKLAEASELLAVLGWLRSEEPASLVWDALSLAYKEVNKLNSLLYLNNHSFDILKNRMLVSVVSAVCMAILDPYSMVRSGVVQLGNLFRKVITGHEVVERLSEDGVSFDLKLGMVVARGDSEYVSGGGSVICVDINSVISALEKCKKQKNEVGSVNVSDVLSITEDEIGNVARRKNARAQVLLNGSFFCGSLSVIYEFRSRQKAIEKARLFKNDFACTVLDYSESGTRVRLRATGYVNIVPDMLIGLFLPVGLGSPIGSICWVKRFSDNYVEVGVRFISLSVEIVPLRISTGRWEGRGSVEFGLVSVRKGQKTKSFDIVVPKIIVPPTGVSEVTMVDSGVVVAVGHVLSEGSDFIHFEATQTNRRNAGSGTSLDPFFI